MKTDKKELIWHIPLLIAVFIQLWPIVFMISTSLKDMDQIFQATLNPLPFPPTFDNYIYLQHLHYCCRHNGDESSYKYFSGLCLYLLRF